LGGLASRISRETKISRPHVYDSLKKLIEKGIANYVIKNGKKYFKPTDPSKVIEYIKEEELELKEKEKKFSLLIPELNEIFKKTSKEKPKVEVYEGDEGVKSVLNDIIKTKKEIIVFNTLGEEFLKYIPEHFLKWYLKERSRFKIKSRQFYTEESKIIKHKMAVYKKIPREYNPVSMFVYGNKVVMFILIKEPLTIKIESDEVAKFYKDQFDLLWKITKK